jgi:serine/threonine protein kinase
LSLALSDKLGVDRQHLAARTRAVLNHGGWGNPDVLLVETESGAVVVKDFSPRTRSVRRWLGPWLLRREAEVYACLEGVESVPKMLGWVDAAALVFEYRPGVLLSRSLAGELPSTFLADLQQAIADLHRRGVVHLDLRHRSNILAGLDGKPVVLDFASALRFDVTTWWGRAAVALLGRVDHRALRKWQVRLG